MLTRQKEFFHWIFGGFATAGLIVGSVWMSEHRSQVVAFAESVPLYFDGGAAAPRAPASVPTAEPTKPGLEKLSSSSRPEGKGGGHLSIWFEAPAEKQSSAALVLDANIDATADLDGLKYEWVLPEGVSIANGAPASGDVGTLKSGDQTTIEAAFTTPAKDNRQITLHVYRMMYGEAMGQTALYNTLDQNAIDTKLASKLEQLEGASRAPASTSSTSLATDSKATRVQ